MQIDEMGLSDGKVLFLLPGTACDYQTKLQRSFQPLRRRAGPAGREVPSGVREL